MRALTWRGPGDVRMETVPDPRILNPRDAIVAVTASAVGDADLEACAGRVPGMRPGDILGRETVGRVVEAGRDSPLRPGQRVVVPGVIACGRCGFCARGDFAFCDNASPAAAQATAAALYGQGLGAAFGAGPLAGGYPGGQAEYLRVPFSDVGPLILPEGLDEERALALAEVLPAGWAAAERAGIAPGDCVAIWGAGPVGLFAAQAALRLGAGRAIVIDGLPRRLGLARGLGAETLDPVQTDVREALMEMTGGLGPDAAIDASGPAEGSGVWRGLGGDGRDPGGGPAGDLRRRLGLGASRAPALAAAIRACRKGGRVVLAGVRDGTLDRFPIGAATRKGLQLRGGPVHVQRHAPDLLRRIVEGEIDPSFVISHRLPLEAAPKAYAKLRARPDDWIRATLRPEAPSEGAGKAATEEPAEPSPPPPPHPA